LIASGAESVTSYDPATGKELWQTEGLISHAIPSPLVADDLVFVYAGSHDKRGYAVRIGENPGRVLWRHDKGTAYVTAYAATKAFNLVLAEGLWDELREHGVDVLACRAGATRTPAFERSKPAPGPAPIMDAGPVAAQALDALGKAPSMVPGVRNGAVAFFMQRFMPRRAAVATMGKATRKMYGARYFSAAAPLPTGRQSTTQACCHSGTTEERCAALFGAADKNAAGRERGSFR